MRTLLPSDSRSRLSMAQLPEPPRRAQVHVLLAQTPRQTPHSSWHAVRFSVIIVGHIRRRFWPTTQAASRRWHRHCSRRALLPLLLLPLSLRWRPVDLHRVLHCTETCQFALPPLSSARSVSDATSSPISVSPSTMSTPSLGTSSALRRVGARSAGRRASLSGCERSCAKVGRSSGEGSKRARRPKTYRPSRARDMATISRRTSRRWPTALVRTSESRM